MCWRTCSRASGSSCLSSSTSCEASYAAKIHQQADVERLGDETYRKVTTYATGFLEPLVGGTEDVLVDFDFATVSENDGEVRVIGIVVKTEECQV